MPGHDPAGLAPAQARDWLATILIFGRARRRSGGPRRARGIATTGDLDLSVSPTPDNARRVLVALEAIGFGDVDLTDLDAQGES